MKLTHVVPMTLVGLGNYIILEKVENFARTM